MRVVRHPEADEELEAAAMVRVTAAGPGRRLSGDVEQTLRRIVAEPKRWRIIWADNRKLNFHRYPYAIVFSTRPDAIYIKAVMHLHRRPFYWKSR